jgi:hypothetical protein
VSVKPYDAIVTLLVARGARAPLGRAVRTIAAGLEPRFRTAIMVSGGIASAKKLPEVDLFHFAPRVNVPVLMLNGVEVDPSCEDRPNRVV